MINQRTVVLSECLVDDVHTVKRNCSADSNESGDLFSEYQYPQNNRNNRIDICINRSLLGRKMLKGIEVGNKGYHGSEDDQVGNGRPRLPGNCCQWNR